MPYEIRSAGVIREAETMKHAERIAIHLCVATRTEATIWRDGKEIARLEHQAPANGQPAGEQPS